MMKMLSRLLCLVLCLPLLVMEQEKIKWQKDGSQKALIPTGSFRWMILNRMVHSENSPIRMRLKNLVTQIGGLMTAINIPHIQPMATV